MIPNVPTIIEMIIMSDNIFFLNIKIPAPFYIFSRSPSLGFAEPAIRI